MPVASSPGQHISADLIGPLVCSNYGNKYILNVIDHYSGWIESYPLPSKENAQVWKAFRSDYFPRHGAPRVLLTDCGQEFRSKGFEEWLRGNRVEHRRTPPYSPSVNGKIERLNGTLKSMLKRLINANRPQWEDELGSALWAIRTNISTVTKHSPSSDKGATSMILRKRCALMFRSADGM